MSEKWGARGPAAQAVAVAIGVPSRVWTWTWTMSPGFIQHAAVSVVRPLELEVKRITRNDRQRRHFVVGRDPPATIDHVVRCCGAESNFSDMSAQ